MRGMLHSEWNHGAEDTRAYILVYTTDPIPSETSFTALRDADAPRVEEAPGVVTKALVGMGSPLRVHGDVRTFTDATVERGASVELRLAPGEGGVASPRAGRLAVNGGELGPGSTLVAPPADAERVVTLTAVEPSRVIRVVHGPGRGLVTDHRIPRRA
jgi:redox-sensitive bicupin YhaK (pirin superfamily)